MRKTFFTIILLAILTFSALPVYAAETACATGLQSLNLTTWAVVCGAGLDAINPCEFAILILLMASLLAAEADRKKALRVGLAFIAAIFTAYFLMGVGLLEFLRVYTLSISG